MKNLSERVKNCIKEVPDFPKPGISFKDITPLLADAALGREVLEELADGLRPLKPDYIAGLEARGFILGFSLAQALGVGFIPIRKPGKLPRPTLSRAYDLEYGQARLELHKEDIPTGCKVVIHDDLLATGGTARAAFDLLTEAGAEVIAFDFLVELHFLEGRKCLPSGTPIKSLVTY